MYSSGANIAYGKNNMWSSSSIGVTETLIRNAVNLNNNGDDLFDVIDDKIVPNADLPLQASNFKITSTDEEIVADETNACSVKVVRNFINDIDTNLFENYMTETESDSKYLVKNGWISGHYSDPATSGYSVAEVDSALSAKANASDVYTKAQVDEALSTKANSADVYTKAQVDDLISGIDTGVTEDELNTKLEAYATKDWVEAAISSGSDVGPMVASQTGSYQSMSQYSYVDFNATPTTSSPMHLFDSLNRNQYNEGYRSSYYLKSAKFSIKGYNSETGEYDRDIYWEYVMKELECRMVVDNEDLGLMVLFRDANTYEFYAKGICQTADDPENYYIHLQFSRKSTASHIPDKLEIMWTFDSETDMIENPYVRVIKENNNDGYVTEEKLDEVQTNIASTYLSKTLATNTYYTKAQVDEAISNIPDGGMVTIEHSIPSQTLTATSGSINLFELAESETMNTIKVNINCTITSNGTDITHNLDDYSFSIKDTSNNTLCTLNSIYETNNTTTLEGSYTSQITSSNKQLVLSITREASTPAESIVLTTTETSIGTISQTISGYITKIYADEHYASKDTPTVMNITNYDESTHTTNKTTYDFGPDFSVKFGLDVALKVTFKTGSPTVQMASAAISTLLQFGLDKLTSGSLTSSGDAYQMDIHNVIGTSQLAALTDFNTWISSYSRYSGTTLNNFLITAAAAEQRYLKSADISNYYTKTEVDALIANISTQTVSKLEWNADVYNMKLEPETLSSQGDTVTMLNFKEGSHTLARIVTTPSSVSPISNIHAHKFSPVNGIEFGYNIDGTEQSNQWSSTLTNVANDNYNATTYSSADLDTIVPSLKYIQKQVYTKIQVDGIKNNIESAAVNKYVQIANVGSLTLPSTINISYTTTGTVDDVRVESTAFEYKNILFQYNGVIFNDTFQFKDKTTQVTFTAEFDANNQYLVPADGIKAYIYEDSILRYIVSGFTIDNNSITKTFSIDSVSDLSENTDYKVTFNFETSFTSSTNLSNEHATLKVIQGTKQGEIAHIKTLENYIRYIIANP